jgi:phenylacetate-CoA ligase
MSIGKAQFNKALMRFGDFATKQNVVNYLDFYQESQWWSREQLIVYQNNKLKELINISMTEVPFYKELYESAGIRRGENITREQLEKLPFVSKADLKRNYPNNCTRKTIWPVKEYFTSGSSGHPFAVLVDNLTMSQARALMLLRAIYSGWTIGDPVFQTGMTLKRGMLKKLKDIFLSVYYASAYDLSDVNLDKYLGVIEKRNIKFLMGYPGSILALADRAGRVGFNQKMEGIVTWGDNLYTHFRKKIEQQFGCKVTDTYGCGEGIQVAAQCPDGYGHYHIFMPHVIVEIVDDNYMAVKRGESGHILLTRLEPGAMPLIRYKVGDVGRLSSSEMCKCGRGFDILEKIEGRDSDFIHTPNGNRLIVHFFTGIFEYYPEIQQFCIYQKTLEEIEIHIVPQEDIEQRMLDRIRTEILEKGDTELRIIFKMVDQIENKKNGKRRFVISDIC